MLDRAKLMAIASLAVAAVVGSLAPSSAAASSPAPASSSSVSITVMTWNINGTGADITAMADFIQSKDPDVLLVQEIQQSAAEGNQVRLLEAELGSQYIGRLHFGRADHLRDPCQSDSTDWVGNAIYSKFPILSHVTFTLPRLGTCPDAQSVNRSLAGVNLALPSGGNVVVWNTHLTPGAEGLAPAQRLMQAEWIEDYLDHPDPLILGGDFNDVPGSATHTTFTSNGWTDAGSSAGPTHSGSRIDYVLTKRATVHSATSPRPLASDGQLLSDHRPVIVELTIG